MNDFESRARKAAEAVREQVGSSSHDVDRGLARTRRSNARRVAPGAVAALAAVLLAVTLWPGSSDDKTIDLGKGDARLASSLQSFDRCDDALAYFKEHGYDYLLNASGYGGGRPVPMNQGAAVNAESADTSVQRSTATTVPSTGPIAPSKGSLPGSSYSTTNVQEQGIDEPDVVKTDGKRIITITGDKAVLLDDNGGRPVVRSTLQQSGASQLLLNGDRVLVIGVGPATGPSALVGPSVRGSASGVTSLSLYDISNASQPRKVSSMEIDGTNVDARMVGSQVRIATSAAPDLEIAPPDYDENGLTQASKDRLRDGVASSKVEDWLPGFTTRNTSGAVVEEGRLLDCADVSRPVTYSGLETVAVTSFDMQRDFVDHKETGVVGGGRQLYATDKTMYVATTEYRTDNGTAEKTYIHKFSTEADGTEKYRGSGEVNGTLLSQYAMSEFEGVLRVASTVRTESGWVERRSSSEGVVTTFGERDGTLQQLGSVGGLGKDDNESIQGVRFIGARGYVVTFRQTDPLFVLDLRDPASPKVTGELKIPGYSGYLHPIGENWVLGVGQGGAQSTPMDSSGVVRMQSPGVQFSLFDVSDPASPKRVDTQEYGSGAAGAQFDAKAFLYWEPRELIIAPTNLYSNTSFNDAFSGLLLLRANAGGLEEVGRLKQTGAYGIQRTFVIDNRVYMLANDSFLQVNSLDSHAETARVRL